MSITYPLEMPSALQFSARNWRKRDVTSDAASPYTGQSTVIVFEGQWVEATLTLRAQDRKEAQKWNAWLTAQKGHLGTFLLGDPLRYHPLGSARSEPGTPLVKGASQTGASLLIDGAPANRAQYLLAGDLIQVTCGGVVRLHEVLQDVATNGSGEATLDLWPNLRASPADNAPLTLETPRGTFHRMSNVTDWQVGSDGISRLVFDCKEYLS